MPDNVDKLFEIMQANGAANDRNKFRKVFLTPGNKGYKIRKDIYDVLRADGIIDSPTYEDFRRKLRLGGTPTVNKYRQQMFNSVDPNKNGLNALSHRAVSQAKRAMNNVRKPVTAKVVDKKGKPTGEEFAITPAKTVEDLDREYAQETTKNWENELHDQMADADKDAAKISDMFKSFIGSTDEVGSVWGNMTRGGGIAGTPHSVTTNNGILENTEARQLLAAGDYNRKRKELLQLEQDSRNGATFDNHSFFRGMYDAAKDTGILTGGASDLINAGSLLATKQDLDNGIHTEAGDMLMQQAVKNSDAQSQYGDNQGWMYTGGVITTNMAPFIVQIASAGFSKGLSTSIGKVVQGAASKVALGTMKKAAGFASADLAKNIGKVTGLTTKAFGKAIQYGIVGAAQANTVGLGNVANDVINRYTGQVYQDEQGNYKFGTFDSDGKLVHEGGEDFLTAFVKGEAAQTIEFATELAGGGIDAAGTALKNFVTKGGKKIINKYNMENVSKVINFLLNNKVAKNARYLKAGADRTLGKVELNSIVGESLEEELGIIANTVFTGDNKISDLWDEKQQSQIWGGMLLSIGLMKGAVAPFHAYNAKQYYSYKHKLNKADVNLSQLLGKEKWEGLRNQIDATTNEDMPEMVNKINRDVALGKNRQPVREYIQNLLIMRGYDIGNMLAAKKAVEDKGEGVSVKNMEKNQAYQQGRDAYGYDTHEIQLDQEDKQKSLAQLLGISEQQLVSMSDEELEELSGRDDNIDRAIYDYQLSSARYEGVVDNARDQIDLEVQRAAQAVDMYTDKSRNTIRNATIKASGGLEDYGVYIISGNIATHDDGSIDVSNSDDMILYYDPTTNTVEHADAMMFAELGSEENADEVRSQAMADAKEKAIKETTGIIDGVVEVGTQFKTVDADGTEHTYEVLADNGDGTAMITIDGNIPTELVKGENVQVPVSFEELQKMKDESDQQRLQAAKAEREQMEKERAEQQMQAQTTQAENPTQEDNIQSTPIEDNIDYSDIIREDGKVQMVDVSDKDGNNLFPDAKDVFYIQGNRMRTKFVYIDANGELKTQSFPTGLVKIKTRGEVSVDDYKKYRNTLLSAESSAIPESSMIEDNSGENRGEIEAEPTTIEDETTPEVAENTETTAPADETAETPSTEQTPAITLEDGTIVPMLEDGNPDFSKLTAAQTAELYDSQFGEDADNVISGWVSDAKKELDKANNMTVKGKTFVEQKAAKDAKEKAIADAQAAYDSAIAIRDAYNERQLAKVEDTAEGRKNLIEKARRKFARLKSAVKDDAEAVAQIYKETVGTLLHRLYDGTGIDVTDTIPLTAEEYVASNLGAHSLNYEGTETSKSVKQETGLSREDFAKTQLLAADGKGTTIDALVHSLWENRPSNLDSLDTQDIRNALIGVLTSGFKASEARSFIENIRIAQAEKLIEEERTAAENAAYYEQQKAKEEEEKKKAELEKKAEEEKKKAELEKKAEEEKKKAEENIDLPAIDKQGEPINNNIIELAKWAKKQGLEIDPTSKLNSYADLFLMCKDGFGVSTLVPDEGKNINQVIYFPDNAEVVEQLGKLQEEFNAGRDLNHSSNIDSEITEGATFYDAATAKEFRDFANEQTKFPDTLREGSNAIEVPEDSTDENPLGLQLSEDKVPFEIEGGKSGETYNINDDEDRQRLINDNKVDDKDILDIDMPKHVHKAIKELCKKMGLKVQFLYMGARSNGWIENGTMYLALDTEKATQFVFGHEMTHAIKQKNPEAYKELVKVAMAVTTRKKFEEDLAKVYQNYHGISGYNNVDDYVEEVVADNLGKFINDFDLAQRFSLRLNHPVLATILHAIQKIKSLLYGDFYKSVDALERIVEKAYVDTANGQVTNSESGEDVSYSLRQKPEPKKKGIGYKVFVLKDGKLYPPMVANPNGAATPVGVWLDADAAPIAGESKTGRPQVKQGGKGTQGGSGKLAYRPGWHLGVVPYAIQFNRKDAEGNKTLFPKNFVFAEVEYAADVDYQEEARQEGINPSGKYQHSLAGLKHLPTDGFYMYRTNPNPETDPWVITGAMKVNRILTRAEQAELVKNAGREPQQIPEGDIVTDDVVNSINQEIADAPKFSIKTYHGSQASFDKFDHSFMGSGEGAQAYGWGTYVSEVEGIAKAYAKQNAKKNAPSRLMYQDKPMTYKTPSIIYQVAFNMDKFNISAKEAISQMIDAGEKKLASVDDTPFAKMKAKQVQDELNVLKGLNPSDFKINEDYDTVAQNLADTKSGLDLLEDELKDAKSYVDLYQSRLDEAKGELSKAKESGTGLGVDMYESDVMYYSEQVEKYKQNVKTKESDIKDVKTKIDALQKKLDSIGKPRNLYSVDIPDDTGDNYIGWDEPITPKMLEAKRRVMEEDGYTMYDSDGNYDYFEKTENGKYQYWQLWNRQKGNGLYSELSKVLHSDKLASLALNKQGIVGVKVIADRTTGGNKEGKMNYVIFDENNAKITNHTKFSLRLKSAIEETETEPSDAQKESGNYKKGHIKFGGYDYTIENPKGSTRSGKDANGKEWKVTMHDTYGYIRGKFGKDGDHLDMFINDKADLDNWDGDVFVVDQVNPDGSFDEHKVMYGYDSMNDAEKAYLANYSKGWQGLGNITGASKAEFDKWLDTSNRKLKPFADYAKVKFSLKDNQGNPLNQDGTLKLDKIKSVVELTDEDFLHPTRNVELPSLPKKIADAIGTEGKPVVIKKNIFERNYMRHKDVTPELSKVIFKSALYNPDLYGQNQKKTRPYNWVLINTKDEKGNNRTVLLEVNPNKDNVEIVHWHFVNDKNLGLIKKQAIREGDQVLILPSEQSEEVGGLSNLTDDLSAAKIDNSSETAKENGEKFSLKDEKTLAGVHNITEEKLRKALKLGGFANPSLAVIDTNKTGHDNFGEISFIAPSALLDKRTGKTAGTWITDAYTQRYPSVEREMSEKGYRKFEDWVASLDYPSGAKAEIERQAKDALSDNNSPAWELMYLKEKGIDIKEYDSRIDYRWKEIISDHPTAEDILNSMKTDPELNEKVTSLAKHTIIHPTWEKVSLEVRRKMYKETGVKASPINPQVRKQTKEIFERDYAPSLLNKNGTPKKSDVKKVVEQMVKEHNDTKKYDFYLSKVKASNYVNKNGLYDDYIRWQENKLDEFGTKNRIFRGYTRDGSRKYVPETLENVSKAMREEADGQTNGSEYTSFGSFIAKLASRVDSTDEMRANKDKLSSNKDKEEFYEKWNEVYYDLAKFLYNDVFYGEQRLHDIVLQSDPKKYAKKEYGITLTPTFMKKLDALKNAVQTELKSAYFETKYNRPLRLNEFAAVVVPDNLGEDVRKGIEDAGLPMYDYDPNKEGDRSRAFNEAINSSDNIRFSLKSMMAKPEGWKQANKKAIHIAEAIERDPKFSLKNLDGTLIKAGTYFSGGGLVEEGLKGIIDPVVAVEYDEKISGVYRNNFGQHIVTADVRDVDPKELVKQIDGEVEYFHASPVCKNYSQAKSNHAEVELDKETAASTAEFINAIKPKVVTIENVKGYKDSEAMKTITDALDANGYTWDADVYNAADYGGYTNRERLIVRAVRDGKLPEKPKKMAHKSGWYEAVADIIPTLTEKKNGVAPWMDIRLKADGIDWRNIDKPLYVMGSAYADGKIPHAFADELLPTLRTKSGDVIVMPDGKVYRAMGRVLARVSGVSDDYKMPFSENLSHTIIGNGIPTQLTEHVIAPLLQNTLRPTTPEDGNTKFSLRGSTPYDKQMEEWMEKNHLEKGAVPMEKPVMKEGENIFDYANRMVEWTRNQNLWKTAPKQTGFQDALDKWKADNGLSPDAYPPVRPHRENYSTEIGYTEDLEEYNKKKELWKSAPKPKDFDLSVDLEDMNKQLRNIRRAVLNQKNYDQRTVKAVSDLVRKMLNIGWGDGLSRGKVGNLLSAAKNATGSNDVKKYLDKAMGILAENYLNRLSTAYDNLINTKGARADQSGVIKMGSLDAKGQAFMSEYKKAINMDDKSLNTYIANIEEDSAKNEDNVEMNDYRLAGIQAAIMYKQQIGGNDADISELKRQIGELKNKKDATKEDKDLLKSLEKKLFENKFDRITMYENLLNNIQRMVKESKGRAKEFREEIAEHKNEILHRANLDLEGVDSTYYDTTTAKKKFVNNDLQRAVFSSTYTFEQFLKFFGKHSANGEGRLYNYFHKLNQDALDEEQLYNEMNRNALDEKTKELFGKNKFMNLVGIDGKGMKEMDVEVTDYSNKETGKRTIHLKQGQMLYIYLVNKETDGEMKLRAMGITEEDVAAIEENLDPRVKAMGEWLQDEYLPECQRRYQATHTKYFGAPMKEVENYFPLAINNRARNVKEDVNQDSDAMSQLAGTSTGAIVTRRVNVIPLDIENADAFEVAFNHLQEMEEWSAMLPFRQDINTLLSYTHFRNQVQNMSSVAYGSGKTLWDEFKQTAQIAAGTYKPKVNAGMMDSRIAAAMGGIAVAKISGRLWTAIKQSQSATVFLPECDFTRFVKNGVNPYGSWKWAMENIPDFRKRVENMTYGDVKLRQYLDELEKWHDWTKTISKIGMAPNILVDGITCAVGARSVYETEVNRLTKLGYPKEKAEEKAYYKAVAAYNKTQQSSGGMYLSPMQVDRTYVSAALSLFKNANYAYGRMQIEACRGLARTYDFWGGKHKTTLIESMTRQIMEEDGLDENTARAIAKATYNRTFRQSIGRLINFATLVPVSWALYKVLPYLLTGDDDDKKNDMIEEAVLKGFATSLSDNYVIPFASNILNAGLKVEDGKPTFDPEVFRYQNLYINPATSDLANIYSMVGNQKWYSVANKLGMLGVQSLIGFNPETVGALYQALSEADYDNGNTAKEWQIGILKAISAPEESIRELYMDELGLKSGDIKKIPLAELEKRYAERQINRDNLLSQVFMDAEDFNGYVDKYQKSFEKKIKDKMDKWDEYDKKKADEFFDTTSDPKLKDMIEKKRAKDANAAADEQIAKEGLNQEKNGKEPSEKAYDAVKMSIDVAEDNAISTYNKVLNKRYAALNDEYNNQTDAMKYIFMSKHPNFKAYKELESEYTNYGKKIKELKEKLVSADGYDAKQTILKQIRAEREKFSELQSKVR